VIDDILANVRGMFAIARGLQIAALLIAAMVVANTMFTVVAERRWELSLSRTLGMTRSQVRGVVLLEALGIGLVGSVAAVATGLAIGFLMLTSMELRFSWAIDYQAQWALVGGVFAIGVASALIASLIPAQSAARAPIVESLRSE
jgi:putative ABC transport system permease protein